MSFVLVLSVKYRMNALWQMDACLRGVSCSLRRIGDMTNLTCDVRIVSESRCCRHQVAVQIGNQESVPRGTRIPRQRWRYRTTTGRPRVVGTASSPSKAPSPPLALFPLAAHHHRHQCRSCRSAHACRRLIAPRPPIFLKLFLVCRQPSSDKTLSCLASVVVIWFLRSTILAFLVSRYPLAPQSLAGAGPSHIPRVPRRLLLLLHYPRHFSQTGQSPFRSIAGQRIRFLRAATSCTALCDPLSILSAVLLPIAYTLVGTIFYPGLFIVLCTT
ncbi:hypothetical protein CC79DRAFT_74251 [Sarocladium strictum]